jgi:hypothetical protein
MKPTFHSYAFSDDDLSCLLWASDHHRSAHDAVIQAENRATDDPRRRAWADTYIADCLGNIRRRMEAEAERAAWAEQAAVIAFGFAMQDRLVERYGPVVLDPPDHNAAIAEVPVVKQKTKPKRQDGGGLFANVK